MTRFFVSPECIQDGFAALDAADAHHLRVVLHATPGDAVSILDGSGREWPGKLDTLGKTKATVGLGASFEPNTEPKTRVTVAFALSKTGEKMEQVLQRGTEIGASGFWAIETARSLTHLTGERQEKRRARWAAIVKTAAEQSHRARLPSVNVSGTLADVLTAAKEYDLTLFASEIERDMTLKATLTNAGDARNILVVIGPEGGWTDDEAARAARADLRSVTLGPRVFRTETAPLVILSQILFASE